MMDFKTRIEETIKAMVDAKPKFNILFVTDETSRLSALRGSAAMTQFRHFYGNIATVTVTTMESDRFCELQPDLSHYNVVWVDNVINRKFNQSLVNLVGCVLDSEVEGWRSDLDGMDDDQKGEYMSLANQYRALKLRVIYCLDEFVWDAPAGRQRNVIEGITVQESMEIADAMIVPNFEMSSALTELGLVPEGKEVLVIPTFVGDSFYPTHLVNKRSATGVSSIRRPKILVKGTTLPKNVQNLIIHGVDEYDFTISTVGELDERLMKLLQTPKSKAEPNVPLVANIKHWSNPYVNSRNLLDTMAMERDAKFDFVILCEPEDIESDIYHLTITDTDALIGVASGSLVIAGIDEAGFGKGIHLCAETGFTFGNTTSVAELRRIIERWRSTASWDEGYASQRKLLQQRLVSSESVMSGFFHAMLGREVSERRKEKFSQE